MDGLAKFETTKVDILTTWTFSATISSRYYPTLLGSLGNKLINFFVFPFSNVRIKNHNFDRELKLIIFLTELTMLLHVINHVLCGRIKVGVHVSLLKQFNGDVGKTVSLQEHPI